MQKLKTFFLVLLLIWVISLHLPVISYSDDFQDRPIKLLPLLYYENDGSKKNLEILWPWPIIKYEKSSIETDFYLINPITGFRTLTDETQIRLLWPITYFENSQYSTNIFLLNKIISFENDKIANRLSFKLLGPITFFDFGKDDINLQLLRNVTFYKNSKEEHEFWLLNKLCGIQKDKINNTLTWRLLFPFICYDNKKGNDFWFIYKLTGLHRNSAKDETSVNLLWPITFYNNTSVSTDFWLINKLTGIEASDRLSFKLLGPVTFFDFGKDEKNLQILRNITFYRNSKNAHEFWLLNMLTGIQKDKTNDTLKWSVLWPFVCYDNKEANDFWFIYKLTGLHRDSVKNETSVNLFWPIIFYNNTKDKHEFWLLNKLSGIQKDKTDNTLKWSILWPFVCYDNKGANDFWFIYKLIGLHHDSAKNETSVNLLWPITYSYKDEKNKNIYFINPISSYKKNISTGSYTFYGLWPFFVSRDNSQSQSYWLIDNITGWRKDKDTEDYRLLWKLTYSHKEKDFTEIALLNKVTSVKTYTNGNFDLNILYPITNLKTSPLETEYRYLWPLIYKKEQQNFYKFSWLNEIGKYELRENKNLQFRLLFPFFIINRNENENSYWLIHTLSGIKTTSQEKSIRLIWPLFYYNVINETKELWVLPYWQSKTPQKFENTLFPIFFTENKLLLEEKKGFCLPGFYYHTTKEYSYQNLLFFYEREKTQNSYNLRLSPIFGYNKEAENRKFNLFYVLYSQEKRKDYFYEQSLGLYKRVKKTDDYLNYLFPMYYYKKTNALEKTNILGWIYNYKKNYLNNTDYSAIFWPLIINRYDENHDDKRYIFWPFYYSNTNIEKNEFYRAILWPLYIEEKKQKEEFVNLLWRIYRKKYIKKEKLVEALPWFTNYENQEQRTTTIWPIFIQKIEDKNANKKYYHSLIPWTKLWPIFYYDKNPEQQSMRLEILWPLFTIKDNPVNYSFNFRPIYNYNFDKRLSLKEHDFIYPIFNFGYGHINSFFNFRPIIWYDRADKNKSLTIFPFYWERKNPAGGFAAFFPFYYHSKYPEGESFVVPPYYSYVTSNVSDKKGIFPIVTYNSKFVGPGKEEKTFLWTLPPVYFKRSPDENKTYIFPFFYSRNNDKEKNTILFPYFNLKNSERTFKAFFPVYNHYESREINWNFIPPVYWSKHPAQDKSTYIVFPFTYYSKSPDSKKIVYPLGFLSENTDKNKSLFLNIYKSEDKKEDIKTLTIFPLFYKRESPEGEKNIILNYFSEKKADKKFNMFFPIYFSWKNIEETGFVIPPVWVEKDKELKRLVIFPLVWYNRHEERHLNVFPILTYTKKANKDKELNIFWKVLTYKKIGNDAKTNFLWKIYESEKKDNFIAISFNPLIQYEKSGEYSTYWAILWRLFSYERVSNKKRIYFLYLFNKTWE